MNAYAHTHIHSLVASHNNWVSEWEFKRHGEEELSSQCHTCTDICCIRFYLVTKSLLMFFSFFFSFNIVNLLQLKTIILYFRLFTTTYLICVCVSFCRQYRQNDRPMWNIHFFLSCPHAVSFFQEYSRLKLCPKRATKLGPTNR